MGSSPTRAGTTAWKHAEDFSMQSAPKVLSLPFLNNRQNPSIAALSVGVVLSAWFFLPHDTNRHCFPLVPVHKYRQTEYSFPESPLWGGGCSPFFTVICNIFKFQCAISCFSTSIIYPQTMDALLKSPWETECCSGLVQ